MSNSAARDLYDRIASAADVQAMVDRNEPERLHLDFKTISRDSNKRRDAFGKYLSGFANSDGGVLVFGVDEPSKGALSDAPLDDAPAFEREVQGLISRVTSHPVPHVEAKSIQTANGPEGYVIVLVPQSAEAPHQAVAEKRYYFRTGDSFKPMEHYQVADQFGKRLRPVLRPYGRLSCFENRPGGRRFKVTTGLRNDGGGIARFPALEIEIGTESVFAFSDFELDGNGNSGIRRFRGTLSRGRTYRGGADDVVHAGAELDVTLLEYSTTSEQTFDNTEEEAIIAKFTVQADGMRPACFTLAVTMNDFRQRLVHLGQERTYNCVEI